MKDADVENVVTLVSAIIGIISNIILLCMEFKQTKKFRNMLRQRRDGSRRHLLANEVDDQTWQLEYFQKISWCVVFIAVTGIFGFGVPALAFFGPEQKWLCQVQAQFIQYFHVAYLLWTGAVTALILLLLYSYSHELSPEKMASKGKTIYRFSFLICWGVPFVLLMICVNQDAFGQVDNQWCWITKYPWERIAFLYGPLIGVFVWNNIAWILSYYWLKRADKQNDEDAWHLFKLFLAYCTSFVIVWAFPLTHRLWPMFDPNISAHWLFILRVGHSATMPLQGLVNLVVFGFMRRHKQDAEEEHVHVRSIQFDVENGKGRVRTA